MTKFEVIMTDGMHLEVNAQDEDDLLDTMAQHYPERVVQHYHPANTYHPRPRRLTTESVYAEEKRLDDRDRARDGNFVLRRIG